MRKKRTKKLSVKRAKPRKRKKASTTKNLNFVSILKVLAIVSVFAAVGIGFVFLDKYVGKSSAVYEKHGQIELTNVPYWASDSLKQKIYEAATAYGEDLKLDKDAALSVQQNIELLVAWLDNVKVQTTYDCIRIQADWRKPLAMVQIGFSKFYLDENMVVLDYLPMPNLAVAKIKGLQFITEKPEPGAIWQKEDAAAAVAILAQLEKMDELITPEKPLLDEIDRIDVSNFDGRKDSRFPHIVLYAKDNTEIIWGAKIAAWQRYLEATDEEKLAKLYSYYKEYGSLLNNAKYINLRNPQDNIPQPIDKY
ncbi:MAG: hypothetical protein KAQ89_04235 [Planctomycetes bacterium]|nr:hypothetical protein [Planctomycetota bacterium]